MRGRQRLLASVRQLFRQQLSCSRTTPIMILNIARTSHGSRPTQAKSLSLGEYVFSPTLHSCLCFHFVSRCLHFATVLSMLVSFCFLVFLFCVLLRKPKKIFLSYFCLLGAFPCKQFSFPLGQGRRYWLHCLVALACIRVQLSKSHITLSSPLCLPADSSFSPMHEHSYYCSHRSVVQVKGNNDDI